jgi:hypothetical protein
MYTCLYIMAWTSYVGWDNNDVRIELDQPTFSWISIVLTHWNKSTWVVDHVAPAFDALDHTQLLYCTQSIHSYSIVHDPYTVTLLYTIHTQLLYCTWSLHSYSIVHNPYTATSLYTIHTQLLYCTWSLHCYFIVHDPYTVTLLYTIHTQLLYCTWSYTATSLYTIHT